MPSKNTSDPRLKQILETMANEKRHCYDYTGKWHLLALTREEYKELLAFLGMEMQSAKFDPKRKRREAV